MAAIISRITRENRDRKLRLKREISSAKCNYELEPFPPCFRPQEHNKFLRNYAIKQRKDLIKTVANARAKQLLLERHQRLLQENSNTCRLWWTECCIITLPLASVCLLMFLVAFLWPSSIPSLATLDHAPGQLDPDKMWW